MLPEVSQQSVASYLDNQCFSLQLSVLSLLWMSVFDNKISYKPDKNCDSVTDHRMRMSVRKVVLTLFAL